MKAKRQLGRVLPYELMLLPSLAGFILCFVIPFFWTINYSFTDWNGLSPEFNYIGFRNYPEVFQDERILSALTNTLWFAFVTTIFQNGLALPLALALDAKIKSKNVLRTIFFMPVVFSPLVIGYLWSYILSSSDGGLLNSILNGVGLQSWTQSWLGNPSLALNSVIAVALWQSVGWSMVIFVANLQGIPADLYESASIDGATGWKKFRYITFHLLAPSFTINLVITMINGLKVFDHVVALTNGGPGFATETMTTTIIYYAFTGGSFGYASTLAVIMFAIIAVISVIQLRILLRKEASIG
ncbi:carbohydrate ABC transporter permease [Paenibacillus sp. GCM10027626]|uniref:carbohydrate ABC transporter permease n=1 Tax=Paenibacillus sp. GCM10027626 TaxID=3273411 RepID=UPI00362F5DA0